MAIAKDLKELNEKYYVKTESVSTKKGCWKHLKIDIYIKENKDTPEQLIGSYKRGYSHLYNTFVPFIQNGKEYALYSKDYTCTSVMSLPDCKQVATEKRNQWGFCPTDFYVPYEEECGPKGEFGFVAGCIWGDDSCWKLEVLDLSKVSEGKITRKAPFGYFELPDTPLKECISFDNWFQCKDEYDDDRFIELSGRHSVRIDENLDLASAYDASGREWAVGKKRTLCQHRNKCTFTHCRHYYPHYHNSTLCDKHYCDITSIQVKCGEFKRVFQKNKEYPYTSMYITEIDDKYSEFKNNQTIERK